MNYPHVTLRWAGLQVLFVAQAGSLRGGILSTAVRCWLWSMPRRREAIATKRLHTFLTDAMIVTSTPQYPRTPQDQRYATRRIVSTAGTAAWLPHAKLRDTRMTSGYGNQSGT